MNQQSKWLQQQYHDIGATLAAQSPVALLHIGSQQTLVMISESSVLTLPLGRIRRRPTILAIPFPKRMKWKMPLWRLKIGLWLSGPRFRPTVGY
ncbi:hypothetical protein [Budvicia aquatica]|uniref:hypothetical protein n=1 Tax=Budvicia aquatica TaxID=82979 RepID=UPI0034CF09AE